MNTVTNEQVIQKLFERIEELESVIDKKDAKIQMYRELLGEFKSKISKALD